MSEWAVFVPREETMTAHVYSIWTWGEEVPDGLIKQIADAIRYNGYRTPLMFAILNTGDQLVWNIGSLLLKCGAVAGKPDPPITEDVVHEFVSEAEEHHIQAFEVVVSILKELDRFGPAND